MAEDETYLEVLNRLVEIHARRFPRRPWRLCAAPSGSGGPGRVLATFASFAAAEEARQARELLDFGVPPPQPRTYWTELRR